MTKEQYLLQWMKERVGNPYIYGATQKDCTPNYRKERIKQYPEYATNITTNCDVLSGRASSCNRCKWYDQVNNKPKAAYDCAQFVRWGAKAVGIEMVSGATSQWRSNAWTEKGEFRNIPNNKLCCVFRDKNGTKQHVGWYYNGVAYHARGHAYGVVRTTNSEYNSWTHYAILKGLYDSSGNPIEMNGETTNSGVSDNMTILYQAKEKMGQKLNLRDEPSKNGTAILQIPGYGIVDVLEETNSEWWKVAYQGTVGYSMNKYLERIGASNPSVVPDSTPGNFGVLIKCNSLVEANTLAGLLGRAEVIEY